MVPVRKPLFPIGAEGPTLVAVDQPPADHFVGLGAGRSKIGAGVRLRHAGAKNA